MVFFNNLDLSESSSLNTSKQKRKWRLWAKDECVCGGCSVWIFERKGSMHEKKGGKFPGCTKRKFMQKGKKVTLLRGVLLFFGIRHHLNFWGHDIGRWVFVFHFRFSSRAWLEEEGTSLVLEKEIYDDPENCSKNGASSYFWKKMKRMMINYGKKVITYLFSWRCSEKKWNLFWRENSRGVRNRFLFSHFLLFPMQRSGFAYVFPPSSFFPYRRQHLASFFQKKVSPLYFCEASLILFPRIISRTFLLFSFFCHNCRTFLPQKERKVKTFEKVLLYGRSENGPYFVMTSNKK